MITGLVKDGFAVAQRKTKRVCGRKIRVAHVRITIAGQKALED
jgi:hypothetical protein